MRRWTWEEFDEPSLRLNSPHPARRDLQSLAHARGREEFVFLVFVDGQDAGEPVGEEGRIVGRAAVGGDNVFAEPGGGSGAHTGDEVEADLEEFLRRFAVELRQEIVRGHGGADFGSFDVLFFGQGDVVDALDITHDVPVQHTPALDFEP